MRLGDSAALECRRDLRTLHVTSRNVWLIVCPTRRSAAPLPGSMADHSDAAIDAQVEVDNLAHEAESLARVAKTVKCPLCRKLCSRNTMSEVRLDSPEECPVCLETVDLLRTFSNCEHSICTELRCLNNCRQPGTEPFSETPEESTSFTAERQAQDREYAEAVQNDLTQQPTEQSAAHAAEQPAEQPAALSPDEMRQARLARFDSSSVNSNPLPLDSQFFPTFLTAQQAQTFFNFCENAPVHEYGFRTGPLKRAPKCEWYRGNRVVYRWGQWRKEYISGLPFPPQLEELVVKLQEQFGESVNHCIMIKYSDGVDNHAPPHKDKQEGVPGTGAKDMTAGSSFFVFSFGAPRKFELVDGTYVDSKFEQSVCLFSHALESGSLLKVGPETNKRYYHAVPKDKDHQGVRYSLIFRTIKPMTPKMQAQMAELQRDNGPPGSQQNVDDAPDDDLISISSDDAELLPTMAPTTQSITAPNPAPSVRRGEDTVLGRHMAHGMPDDSASEMSGSTASSHVSGNSAPPQPGEKMATSSVSEEEFDDTNDGDTVQ
jgi:alkylated DNA repair dioxygenase AlkB